MALNPEVVGSSSQPFQRSWTQADVQLYALGVGAGAGDATSELEFTTENSDGVVLRTLPTFTTIVGQEGAVLGLGGYATPSIGQFDLTMLLHAEQGIRLHCELPTETAISVVTRVVGMYDKGAAGLVVLESTATLPSGEPAFTNRSSLFIRGAGGFGGPRNPELDPEDAESLLGAEPMPTRAPDMVVTYPTRPDQALLYRLNGDHNPLHSDPAFARRAGFDRPILHGLCTYGFTGRALLHQACGSDPSRFGAMRARFSRPTFPGDTLTVSVWDAGDLACGAFRFRTETQRGEAVIDAGVFLLAG